MKRVYEDLWINIVKIKPPWKFLDTLQCFEKHWIAVFSYVYSKDFKHKLEQLVTIWKKQHHVNCSQDKDVENLVETTVCILQFVKKVSKEVGKAIDRCIATLKVRNLLESNFYFLLKDRF